MVDNSTLKMLSLQWQTNIIFDIDEKCIEKNQFFVWYIGSSKTALNFLAYYVHQILVTSNAIQTVYNEVGLLIICCRIALDPSKIWHMKVTLEHW
jgi:hypothetical protein